MTFCTSLIWKHTWGWLHSGNWKGLWRTW